jgi:hypothetical protein
MISIWPSFLKHKFVCHRDVQAVSYERINIWVLNFRAKGRIMTSIQSEGSAESAAQLLATLRDSYQVLGQLISTAQRFP